jgi:outer membrane protein OmpA-like peptidoglycan-associated protein
MRAHAISRWSWSILAAAAASVAPAAAWAQQQTPPSLALDRFTPAPAGDRMFGVQSPFVAGDPDLHVMLLGDYAHNPLVLVREQDDENVGAIVSDQLFVHLNGSLALWSRLNLSLDIPAALLQDGESPTGDGAQAFSSPTDAQLGDVRLGLRLRLFGDYHDIFQLAIGGYVWLPTGAEGSFVSDGTVRGMPQLIAGGRGDRVVWSVAVGPDFRGEQSFAGSTQGTMFQWGAGLGLLLGDDRQLQIGPELTASLTVSDVARRTTNAEVLLDARYRVIDALEIGIGLGPGLTSGIGTPDLRGVAMVAFTPEQKPAPKDRDKDGILDDKDACPDTFGVPSGDPKKNGCPLAPSDRDNDGILDAKDACPDVVGVPSDDPKKNGCPGDRDNDGILDAGDACPDVAGVPSDDPARNGCPPPPPDRDGDGVPDAEDACPDIAGVKTADPKTNGCPLDADGDRVLDAQDACPSQPGKPHADPKRNGCPDVMLTDKEIVILEQVQFDTGKATIKPVSGSLLDTVATVLKDNPGILKIEVQGHTDDRGGAGLNKLLSQNRANSVKKALVARGIDARRLEAKGYGQSVPIGDNGTDEGRQQNRRVQFVIRDKATK